MSIVISQNYSINADFTADINADNPLIGYENLTTFSAVTATSELTGYPATNLANPATNLVWQADDTDEAYVTVIINRVDPVDYVAIARHNLGTGQVPISIEGLTDSLSSPTEWVELVQDALLGDDSPALFRFAPQSLYAVRIRLQPGILAPSIGVLYTGKLLVVQRRVYVGHSPLPYSVSSKVTSNRSESGNFLGRIIINEQNTTNLALSNLDPVWYRQYMAPFIDASQEFPFFFAWRPSAYPQEVGYCWMSNTPIPSNQLSNGFMQISMQMTGIVS